MTGVPEQISLLLFRVGEVPFGVDAEQVLATEPYRPEEGEELRRLDRELGFAPSQVFRAPTVITVGARGGTISRIVVDALEEIAEFPLDDFRPFPPLLEPHCLRRGMWGVLRRGGALVLLIDFTALPAAPAQAGGAERKSLRRSE